MGRLVTFTSTSPTLLLTKLLTSAPAYADTEAETPAIFAGQEVGLVRSDDANRTVCVYFPYGPRDLPEWLDVAMVDFEAPGRIFRARPLGLRQVEVLGRLPHPLLRQGDEGIAGKTVGQRGGHLPHV